MRELRVLLAAAEHGSFRKASAALHITQPAVTNTIVELEAILGVTLFDRSTRGVTPTEHGAAFIRRAAAIFGELDLAAEEIDVISTGSRGALHLGTVPMPAAGIVPAALMRLQDEHSGVYASVFEASEQALVEALKSRRIELFISRLPQQARSEVLRDETLRYETLYEDTLCVIAKRDHSLVAQSRISYGQLLRERWVLPPPDSQYHRHIQRVLQHAGYEMPRHSIEAISLQIIQGMIAHGGFLAFATRIESLYTPLSPLISVLPVKLPEISAAVGVVTLRDRRLSAVGVHFLRHIRELAQAAQAPDATAATKRPVSRRTAHRSNTGPG